MTVATFNHRIDFRLIIMSSDLVPENVLKNREESVLVVTNTIEWKRRRNVCVSIVSFLKHIRSSVYEWVLNNTSNFLTPRCNPIFIENYYKLLKCWTNFQQAMQITARVIQYCCINSQNILIKTRSLGAFIAKHSGYLGISLSDYSNDIDLLFFASFVFSFRIHFHIFGALFILMGHLNKKK